MKKTLFVLLSFLIFLSGLIISCSSEVKPQNSYQFVVEKKAEVFFNGDKLRHYINVYLVDGNGNKTEITDYDQEDKALDSSTDSKVTITYKNYSATIDLIFEETTNKGNYTLPSLTPPEEDPPFSPSLCGILGGNMENITTISFHTTKPSDVTVDNINTIQNSEIEIYLQDNHLYFVGDRIIACEDCSYYFCAGTIDEPGVFPSLTTIKNIEILDTSNVTNISYMFLGCSSLTSLDVSGWDTSKVINMNSTFYSCSSLTSLNLSNWNTSEVTNIDSMFQGCSSLTSLNLSEWNTSKVTRMENVFNDCNKLAGTLDLSNWNTSKVTIMAGMFDHCSSLTSIIFGEDWNTEIVEEFTSMFRGCSGLTGTLDLSDWGSTSNVQYLEYMFTDCSGIESIIFSNQWSTSSCSKMQFMFKGCSSLTSLNLSNWDTSNVFDMCSMFEGCKNLTSLDLSDWNTSNVQVMESMFSGCTNLSNITFSNNFTTTRVTTVSKGETTYNGMKEMFKNCSSLTSLDLSSFDINSTTGRIEVPDTTDMFKGCTILDNSQSTIKVSKTDDWTGKITSMSISNANRFYSEN